jgi:membrane-bound acyltransferase YfiQ involved in biofilm formation
VLAGIAFTSLPWSLYARSEFWKTSPNLFLIRAGSVLVLLGFLYHLSQSLRKLPQALQSLSQESFSVYFVHVCILYGSIWNVGLLERIGPRLSLAPTLVAIVALVTSMALFAWVWNWFKKHERRGMYLARTAIVLALVLALL